MNDLKLLELNNELYIEQLVLGGLQISEIEDLSVNLESHHAFFFIFPQTFYAFSYICRSRWGIWFCLIANLDAQGQTVYSTSWKDLGVKNMASMR